MPIIKNSEDYKATEADEEIIEEIHEAIEHLINSHKVEMALAALYMYARPNGDPNNIYTPGFIESIDLIYKLSPGGKLKLAGDLIDDVRL